MVFTFIQNSHQEILVARLREAKPEMCTLGTSCLWNCYLCLKSIHQSMLSSSWRRWEFPHIYYLQRHKPLFFFLMFCLSLLVHHIAGAYIALDCFHLFYLHFTPDKLPPSAPCSNSCMGVVKMEATDLREDTSCVLLCPCLYTGVEWRFGNTIHNTCNTHTETRDQHLQTTSMTE